MGEGKESGIISFSVFGIIMLLIWSEGKIIYSLFWGEGLILSPDRVGWKCSGPWHGILPYYFERYLAVIGLNTSMP